MNKIPCVCRIPCYVVNGLYVYIAEQAKYHLKHLVIRTVKSRRRSYLTFDISTSVYEQYLTVSSWRFECCINTATMQTVKHPYIYKHYTYLNILIMYLFTKGAFLVLSTSVTRYRGMHTKTQRGICLIYRRRVTGLYGIRRQTSLWWVLYILNRNV